ncbi:lycopene cyclase domain-containing protein [Frankia gtarii]|uniref:lycopene cyclase domain-containing protein n=1 Tax=Frankia gtarii TaxID=2950102 RepID=UPI0021C0472A|nr:lycopene cyclase domain-containing protein [Frankia gtarii]
MRHLSYLAVLAACLLGTAPLELFLGTRVYARPRRLLLTLLPVVLIFVAWDVYAIAAGHWSFDPRSITGVRLPGHLPLDELLFFLVVPVCAVLTLEAVRAVRGWPAGDEPGDEPAAVEEAGGADQVAEGRGTVGEPGGVQG